MYFQRLKDMRDDAELKQETVAKHLGIRQNVYSRYERGERTIPIDLLIKLADFYNVSLDYLTGRTRKQEVNR